MENLEEARPDALIGTVVDNRFEILALVGEGGIGVVYRARHVLMDRILAFKMLRSEFLSDQTAFGRFQQEARAVCALSHPNIVAAHDFGITSTGNAYLAMDFLEGDDLDTFIAERGALPLDQSFPLFLQICEALHHAHKVGIIHRDLKPSNIVLLSVNHAPPVVKLVDFGMAKFTAGASPKALKLTKPGDVFGSPYYMSPEQFSGPDLDARSDIYSLGCLMYETLTGLPPHMGEDYLEVMRNHLAMLPQAKGILAEPNPVSAELKRIVFKALEKSAADRYQNVGDLLEDLKRLIDLHEGKTSTSSDQVGSQSMSGAHGATGGRAAKPSSTTTGSRPVVTAPDKQSAPAANAPNQLAPPGISKGMIIAAAVLLLCALGGVYIMMNPRTDSSRTSNTSLWQELEENAGKAAHAGELSKAEELYKKAVEEAEKHGEADNPELSKSLQSLGILYQREGKFVPAEESFKRSIAICKKESDFDASQLSPLLGKLGDLYKHQGRTADADDVYKQARQIINGDYENTPAK